MEDLAKLGELLPRSIVQILIAIVCGGLIGLERGSHHRSSALRENILICTGVTLFMIIAELIMLRVETSDVNGIFIMATGVVIGSAFLGAGFVLRSDADGKGMSSAATIWVVTAVGLIIGTGNSLLAMLVTGIVLMTLILLTSIERSLKKRSRPLMLKLTLKDDNSKVRKNIQDILENHNVKADKFRSERVANGFRMTIQAKSEPPEVRLLTTDLWGVNGVTEVEH